VLVDSLATRPGMKRWMKAVGERPAVQRGMQVPKV
jgi:GST-like protein